jgi:heme/copper-type cytochrome/quinol oxidase subunit 3
LSFFISLPNSCHHRCARNARLNKISKDLKKKSTSKSAFFNLRVLIASVFCLFGIAVALFAQGRGAKQTQQAGRSANAQDAPGTQNRKSCK